MELDEGAIEEFKRLYLKKYGRELTDELATDYGMRLIMMVRAVYGNNLPRIDLDKEVKKDND